MKRHAALVPLSRQHHDGLALGVFIRRGLQGVPDPSALERLRQQALDLWELELRGHFEAEEEALFPAVRDAIPDPELVDQLIAEHDEMRTLFASLKQVSDDGLQDLLREVREILVRHIRTEERVLFETVQDSLDEHAMAVLGSRIEERLSAVCVSMGSAEA